MTRLFNDPSAFPDEMVTGFVAAHPTRVRRVTGGVVRRSPLPRGQVAVVIGGGSGHYPAFAGLVGPGLAAGAVMGEVFASPSAQQVAAVVKAVEVGGGVLLAFGNYAGDVLNFDAAADRLRREGLEVESVAVTDDVCSAPADQRRLRRGIAGDLCVFKIASAAAAEGLPLAEVAAYARRADERTRSIGVAFSGCTLPGADAPLFTVPAGKMAVGLGIHGEPGLSEVDLPSADGLADLLVGRLLDELPDDVGAPDGQRAVALLNGLGTIGQEELFVVFGRVHALLTAAGVTLVEPEVGNLCTSFDMSGVSLTLTWLDDDLERLWRAPADAPAFRRGRLGAGDGEGGSDDDGGSGPAVDEEITAQDAVAVVPPASPGSQAAAAVVVAGLDAIERALAEHADELGRLDAVAGDGDHGIGMQRGSAAGAQAARDALAAGAGAGSVLVAAGDGWSDRAGGTSGALWGVALQRFGDALGDEEPPTPATLAAALHAARDGICTVGKAEVGDKTMVDVLVPLDDAFSAAVRAGSGAVEAWDVAAAAAEQAAAATADLLPRKGRARPHAERSLGTPDAGAVSLSLVARTVHRTLAARSGSDGTGPDGSSTR